MIAVILVAVGVIAQVSKARRTSHYLQDLALQEPDKVMEAMTQLRARGASVGPRLAELVQAGDETAAPRAAWLLGLVKSEAGDQALVAALTSPNTTLRVAALQSLGQLRLASAQPAVAGVLADATQKPEVRASAAYALGMMGLPESAGALAKALADRPQPVPPVPPSPVPPAAAVPPPPDTTLSTRLAAALALGQLRAVDGVAPLAETLKPDVEPSPEVRVAAAYALGDVAANVMEDDKSRAAAEGLLTGLADKVGDVRVASAYALGKVALPTDMEAQTNTALKAAYEDKHYWARLAAQDSHSRLKLAD